ncbi:hypothetical protein [Streptomyces sp. NPDC048338]|uniref:hypothetical protein n=1 Tax=Streptomyces sp. NPDC048338 TaxID=3365536 RepID=UPI003717B7DB
MTAHATSRPTGEHATPATPPGAAGGTRPATDGLVDGPRADGETVALGGAQPPAVVLPAPPASPASRTGARAAVLPGAPSAPAAVGLPTPTTAGAAPSVEALLPPAPPVEAFVVPVPDVADPVVPAPTPPVEAVPTPAPQPHASEPVPQAAAAPEPEAPVRAEDAPAEDAPAAGALRPRAVVGTVPIPAPAPKSPAPYVRAVRLAPGVADASGPPAAGVERRAAVSVRPVRLPLARPADAEPTAPPTTRTTEEPQP